MKDLTVTIKVKGFKLKLYIQLMRLVVLFDLEATQRMYDWLFNNLDKFYTIKM